MDAPLPEGLVPAWHDFLLRDRTPTGLDVYDDVFDHPLVFPLQRRREMARMIRAARSVDPITVMVIGADKGGDVYHFVKGLESIERVIVCEIRGTPYAAEFESVFKGVQFDWHPRGSRDAETLDGVRHFLGKTRIDVLFIDGDKNAFQEDFDAYLPLMREGGIVLMHDVHGEAPPVVVFRRLQRQYRTELILDTSEGWEAQERARRGEKPKSSHDQWNAIWGETSCGVGVIRLP